MYSKKEYPKGKQHFPWVKFWSFRMCGNRLIQFYSVESELKVKLNQINSEKFKIFLVRLESKSLLSWRMHPWKLNLSPVNGRSQVVSWWSTDIWRNDGWYFTPTFKWEYRTKSEKVIRLECFRDQYSQSGDAQSWIFQMSHFLWVIW